MDEARPGGTPTLTRTLADDPRSDDELITAVRAGDGDAFTALVRRHTRLVYRVALRLTGNASDAEEVLQDTFVQLHRRLDTFAGQSKLSTWIYRVAVNAALMHLRARKSRIAEQPLDDYLPELDAAGTWAHLDRDYSSAARADEIVESRELARAALAAVAELPEAYRVPFVLRDLEGLDSEETATLLGLDVALVRQRLHRARLMLRATLTKLVGAES